MSSPTVRGISTPHPIARQTQANAEQQETYSSSVRSNFSDILVGSFLGPQRPISARSEEDAPDVHTPLAPPQDARQPLLAAPLMYTPSGYGALPRHSVEGGLYPTQTPHHEAAHGDDKEIIYRELALLSRYTASIWATHLLELSLSMVSVFSLGHLGTLELAAASLAGMTANVTGFSMISGLVCALDTLLPATYVRQPRYMGLWTQRVGVVVFCVIPLIILLWLNAERGLLLLGQDPEIAHLARQFLAVLAIGLPGHAVFELCRRFLQAQGMMHAPTVVLLVVSPINAVANYLLVWGPHKMRFGFLGAPMASAISMWLMAVLCMLQCALVAHKNGTWGGWSYKAFDPAGLRVCVALGFAGVLSLASEWWAWEIVGLVTAALGTTSLAAQSVLLITSSVTYQLPYGASVAAAVRVGNLLGGGHMSDARLASLASLLLSVIIGMLNSSVVYVSRDKWGYLFSNDVEVIRLVASVLPILAIFQCADCICGVAGGILRGSGRQSLSAAINLTSYYVIGMPMCLFLAFGPLHMGLRGLWWGLTVALVYGAGIALFYVWYTDWTDVMHRLHRSMSVDDEHV